MKDFAEFKGKIEELDTWNEIGQFAVEYANNIADRENFGNDSSAYVAFHQRTVIQLMILKTLEEYHKWLHESDKN